MPPKRSREEMLAAQERGRRNKFLEAEHKDIVFVCRNCEHHVRVPIVELQQGIPVTCPECDEDIVQTANAGEEVIEDYR